MQYKQSCVNRLGVGKKIMEDVILEESHYLNEEIKTNNGKAFNISVSQLFVNFLTAG